MCPLIATVLMTVWFQCKYIVKKGSPKPYVKICQKLRSISGCCERFQPSSRAFLAVTCGNKTDRQIIQGTLFAFRLEQTRLDIVELDDRGISIQWKAFENLERNSIVVKWYCFRRACTNWSRRVITLFNWRRSSSS